MTRQKTILIVDDEERLRQSLSLVLQKENYRVVTAAHGNEALHCLQVQEYDLMFLDLNMPGMSGIDVLVEVHRRFPHLPVIILTAYGALETAIQAIRLGARDYLIKPVEPVLILTHVAEILTERDQPGRRKEILDELQALLAELQKIDGEEEESPGVSTASSSADPTHVLKKGLFELDVSTRHATLNDRYLPVSGVNFDYLRTLLVYAPKPVAYKTLVKESQGYEAALGEARELARWRIHELRKVVEVDPRQPRYILTVRGTGYRLAV